MSLLILNLTISVATLSGRSGRVVHVPISMIPENAQEGERVEFVRGRYAYPFIDRIQEGYDPKRRFALVIFKEYELFRNGETIDACDLFEGAEVGDGIELKLVPSIKLECSLIPNEITV